MLEMCMPIARMDSSLNTTFIQFHSFGASFVLVFMNFVSANPVYHMAPVALNFHIEYQPRSFFAHHVLEI